MSNPMQAVPTSPVPSSQGDLLLEKASLLVTRYGDVQQKLSTVLQRVGLSVDSPPSSEKEEGFGFMGRMDVTLRVLDEVCDDIERQAAALEATF